MNSNPAQQLDIPELRKKVFLRVPLVVIALGIFLFLPAGSLLYWQAWLYGGVITTLAIFTLAYFLMHDPEFLDRRMRLKEKERQQKAIIKWGTPIYLIFFLTAGFDYRFDWSEVPVPLVIVGDFGAAAGYLLIVRVFKQNRYASRVIEVEKGQPVITTGLYAIVRHPMYASAIVLYTFSALALGSYWALIPALLIGTLFIPRIMNEEDVLKRELAGYQEYMQKTRYRIAPGVW